MPIRLASVGSPVAVQRSTAILALAVVTAAAGCGLTGPGDPERSIVGTYRGQWKFGVYDPDTVARIDDPPGTHSRGWVYCPGEFQVTDQDDKDIKGRFELRPPDVFATCNSLQGGFCSETIIAKFCRSISGTLEGEAFSTGSPAAETILFKFRMTVGGSEGRAALGRFIGCTVVAEEKDVFTGGVRNDLEATATAAVTAECGGQAGLDRVDVAILLNAGRVAGQ